MFSDFYAFYSDPRFRVTSGGFKCDVTTVVIFVLQPPVNELENVKGKCFTANVFEDPELY